MAIIESISFEKDIAYSGKSNTRHIDKEYAIVSDLINDNGERVIILKEKDLTGFYDKISELVNLIMASLGETSPVLKGLLNDYFHEHREKTIENIIRKLNKGASVKAKEGCFKIIIGDGRRKNSEEIMLRE